MKNTKRYLSVFLTLAIAASAFVGCDNELEDFSSKTAATPSDKFNTQIQVVSRLSDGALASSDADFAAIKTYLVTTLEGKEKSWLTVLDRVDGNSQPKVMQLALDTYRWSAFAFNRIVNKTSYQGSTLLFNYHSTEVRGIPVGNGAYVTAFSPKMVGTRTDKDEAGEVTAVVPVSFKINFRTVRFETSEQLSAFGGANGVFNTLKREQMNMLMLGTVKNDLFESLQSTVAQADAAFKVHRVAQGSGYSIFMLAEQRFWGLAGVTTKSLGNGIEAYEVNVMW